MTKSNHISGRNKFQKLAFAIKPAVAIFGLLPVICSTIVLGPWIGLQNNIGVLSRYLYYGRRLRQLGDSAYLASKIVIKNGSKISIGHNCSIHEFCYFDGYGGLEIGDDVAIAHGCSILTTNHGWSDPDTPIKYNAGTEGPVRIHDDVWLGCGVKVLPGVEIGPHTVVAAGAIVTKSLEGGYLYAGVPARQVKQI